MRLNIYDRQTHVWRPLPKALQVDTPSWSHDSAFIYYKTEGTRSALRRVRVSDGSVEDFRSLQDDPIVAWGGLAPDDSPLLLRDVGPTNLYALRLGRR